MHGSHLEVEAAEKPVGMDIGLNELLKRDERG